MGRKRAGSTPAHLSCWARDPHLHRKSCFVHALPPRAALCSFSTQDLLQKPVVGANHQGEHHPWSRKELCEHGSRQPRPWCWAKRREAPQDQATELCWEPTGTAREAPCEGTPWEGAGRMGLGEKRQKMRAGEGGEVELQAHRDAQQGQGGRQQRNTSPGHGTALQGCTEGFPHTLVLTAPAGQPPPA